MCPQISTNNLLYWLCNMAHILCKLHYQPLNDLHELAEQQLCCLYRLLMQRASQCRRYLRP